MIKAYAEPNSSGSGSQNRQGSGENYARGADQQRRGNESMGNYYRRTGQSALGASSRTRGKLAPINQRSR